MAFHFCTIICIFMIEMLGKGIVRYTQTTVMEWFHIERCACKVVLSQPQTTPASGLSQVTKGWKRGGEAGVD